MPTAEAEGAYLRQNHREAKAKTHRDRGREPNRETTGSRFTRLAGVAVNQVFASDGAFYIAGSGWLWHTPPR
jgi:hypothetical protein